MSIQIACHGCDLLIELPKQVAVKSKLSCPRCQHTLTRGHKNALDYTIAIAISCLITLVLSYSFSFMSFETQGQFREISLIQTTFELFTVGHYFLAVLVFLLTIVLPVLYLLVLLRVLLPIRLFQETDHAKSIASVRVLNGLIPWLMVDVFLIGVLVAIIKMWSLASLSFGVSFWVYVLFVLQFSYVLYIVDAHKLWQWVNNED
jgi:paraquat-inducible protein A